MTENDTDPDTETEGVVEPSTDLEAGIKLAVDKLRNEGVKFSDLVDAVAPKRAPAAPAPEHLPLPAIITEDERAALQRLPEVFGAVVPTERRILLPEEAAKLRDERIVLKTIEGMVKTRSAGIRTSVFNSLDVEAEAAEGGIPEGTYKDADGHYVLDGSLEAEGSGEKFTREVRGGSPSVDPSILEALGKDGDFPEFTHADYLKMTTQVRVFDEAKAIIAMRKNPALLKALAKATSRTRPTAAMYVRKAK